MDDLRNKKQATIIWLVITVIFSGCAPAYKFLKKDEIGGGYVVRKKKMDMPYFTIDSSEQYPEDLRLAKERFKRRRYLIERYYRDEYPELYGNLLMTGLKFLTFYSFIPVSGFLMEYFDERSYRKIEVEEIKRFIEEDCKKEFISK